MLVRIFVNPGRGCLADRIELASILGSTAASWSSGCCRCPETGASPLGSVRFPEYGPYCCLVEEMHVSGNVIRVLHRT